MVIPFKINYIYVEEEEVMGIMVEVSRVLRKTTQEATMTPHTMTEHLLH